MAPRYYWSDGLTWACNAGIFVFGIVLAVLGALLPALFERIQMDPAQAGTLFLFLNFGALLATFAGGPAFDRFGYRAIMVLASLFCSGALAWMATADRYPELAASSFLLGLGGGGLNAGTNALIADLYPQERGIALNRLGIFFGLGTFFIPFFIGMLLESLGTRIVLSVAAGIGALPGLLFLIFAFPPPKQAGSFPVREAFSLLRNPLVILLGVLLFFQSGNEITTSGWLTTFLVDELSISAASASLYLSVFWGLLVLGRFVSSLVLRWISEATLVQIGALAAAVSTGLLIAFPDPLFSVILAGCIGFFMAAVFPSVLGQASARFPEFSGTVIGTLIGIALMGGMLFPWLAGIVTEQSSVGRALMLPVGGFVAVFLIQTLVKKRSWK